MNNQPTSMGRRPLSLCLNSARNSSPIRTRRPVVAMSIMEKRMDFAGLVSFIFRTKFRFEKICINLLISVVECRGRGIWKADDELHQRIWGPAGFWGWRDRWRGTSTFLPLPIPSGGNGEYSVFMWAAWGNLTIFFWQ